MAEDAQSYTRDEIADVLAEARVVREALLQAEPGDDSQATHELAIAPERSVSAVKRLIAIADLWTLVAGDQLYGLSLLVRDGTTVFSLFPILRSVFEHSASVAWVLDAEVDIQARTARAALAELRSQDEAAKAASRMGGKGSETHMEAKERRTRLRADVEAEFGPFELSPLQLVGETLPAPTDLIKEFGKRWGDEREWVGVYDYLCQTANHPSLLAAEYFDWTNPTAGATISADILNRLLRAALVPYLRALQYLCAYMGWPTEPLDSYFEDVNRVVPASSEAEL